VRERLDIGEAEANEIRNFERARASDVAQGVATDVAIGGSVRQFADAHAIEHNPDYAVKMRIPWRHCAPP
jgi:hypothetical protein